MEEEEGEGFGANSGGGTPQPLFAERRSNSYLNKYQAISIKRLPFVEDSAKLESLLELKGCHVGKDGVNYRHENKLCGDD